MPKSIKTYNEAVAFIESLSNISPGGERRSRAKARERLGKIKKFLKFLGNPEKKFKIIHIAGTSGKGSVAVFLHSILLSAGKKTGTYTSPHTTTYCERFKVGEKFINEKDLVRLTNYLKDKMDEFIKPTTYNPQPTTSLNFFEFSICLAFLYFAEKKCNYVVMETGMGGRFDATNAAEKTDYAIITNIGRDHLKTIGPALADVAYEKAGIIKPGARALTGERRISLLKIISKAAKKITDYKLRITNYEDLKNIKTDLNGTGFEYCGEKYHVRLPGAHQAKNAALAIECAKDLKIPAAAIKNGLALAEYPARLEIISKKPLIIIDGAHNMDKVAASINFIKHLTFNIRHKYLILGMAKNKKADKSIKELISFFDKICLTRFENPFRKANSYADWMRILAKTSKKKIYYKHRAEDALLDILPKLRNNSLLLITGSIFLAGELRKHWHPEEKIINSRKSTFFKNHIDLL